VHARVNAESMANLKGKDAYHPTLLVRYEKEELFGC
jgi:hypothetical protein